MASRSRRGGRTCGTTTHPGGQFQKGSKHHHPPGIPDDLQETRNSTAGGKRTFEHAPANGHVLVVMRYKQHMDRRIRNCLVRMLTRIRQPGTEGRCLGVTDKVEVLECPRDSEWSLRDDWCLALFLFPSESKARLWYNSEPELKQHDFLPPSDGVQLFVVKLRYLPKMDKGGRLTFNWMEMYNVQCSSFLQHEFVDKVAPLLDDQQVNHGLVFLRNPTELFCLKESWITHSADAYCVVHVFNNEDHFESVYGQAKYADLRQRRSEVCEVVSLLFTIDSNITGMETPRK